jgi:mannose-6-phosphate isomerase-like protein (cupin superfamily)
MKHAANFPIITEKPWGNESLIFQGHGYAVKKISLNENQQTSLHFHNLKHETISVHSGLLSIYLKHIDGTEENIIMNPGESLPIAPKIIHRMSSKSGISVYFEAQTDHLDDVVRISDSYGRG